MVEPLERRTLFAAGDLDPSFGLGGYAPPIPTHLDSESVTAIDVANGRVVLGGIFDPDGDNQGAPPRVSLAVLDSSGKLVRSFSGDGVETEALSVSGGVIDLLVQPDNKIVVLAGNQAGQRVLVRFNANGTLDTAFGQKSISLTSADDIARTPAGDIVVAGSVGSGETARLAVVRFAASGSAKGQLVTNVTGVVDDMAVAADGKLVIVGALNDGNGDTPTVAAVFRIKSDLSGVDSSFDGDGVSVLPGSGESGYDSQIEIDGQGRIVAAVVEDHSTSRLFRLLSGNGALDPSFTSSVNNTVEDLSIAPDGKIILSGEIFATGYYIKRFNSNGTLDTSFGEGGFMGNTAAYDPREYVGPLHDVQPDGRSVTTLGYSTARMVANNSTPVGTVVVGADRVLRITGTEAGNDLIGIADSGDEENTGNGGVYVRLNGRWFEFSHEEVTRIEVTTLGGNDRVDQQAQFGGFGSIPGQLPLRIDGGVGDDYLLGGSGNDTLVGKEGNDYLFGDAGDDLLDGGQGTDVQMGGLGADTIDYHFRNSAVFVDLDGLADDGPAGEKDTVGTDVEHIIGGNGSDILTGDGRPNFIRGNGGNDTIRGGGGNDTLVGGSGQDRLFGDAGDDFLDARDGITDLVLDGGAGFDKARKDNSDPRTSIEQLV